MAKKKDGRAKSRSKAAVRSDKSAKPADSIELDVLARRVAILYEQGHLEAARQVSLEALSRQRDHIDLLFILASTLRDMGRFDEALTVLRHLLGIDPDHARARAAAALTLFYKEDWPRAWRAFDVRFKLMAAAPKVTGPGPDGKPVPKPVWRGGPMPPSLLVLGEQGLGDTIMFVRFLPMLTAAGTKVTCVVQRRLFRLLKTLEADVDLRPSEESGTVAGIRAWTPLMHLPQVLDLPADKLAPKIPYLRAEPERIARWRTRLGDTGFKIGIVWQGNPDKRIDQGRSAPLAAFAPLADIPGVRLISLQKDAGSEQLATVPFAGRIETLGEDFDAGDEGFLDSAAALECLDLLVTVDTAIGHLAGALGRPVIILLKRIGADWRWLYDRSDSVWYPTAHLMRQRMPGDWSELLGRAAAEVRRRAAANLTPAAGAGAPQAPVSVGELIDKLTILEIKRERIGDAAKLANVERERAALAAARANLALPDGKLDPLAAELKRVNEALWEIEDEIRDCERKSDFGPRFVELARSVYRNNDRRAAIKNEINRLSGSAIVEEKSYKGY